MIEENNTLYQKFELKRKRIDKFLDHHILRKNKKKTI